MLNTLWRVVGWLLLPAALLLALVVFSPFAVAFTTWGLMHPGLVGGLLLALVAVHYVRKAAQAAVMLHAYATRRSRARRAALAAVQSAVLR